MHASIQRAQSRKTAPARGSKRAKASRTPGELEKPSVRKSSPGVLLAFALFEPLAGAIFLLCALWMLACMVAAVRQALDYRGNLRAIAVCAIGFPVYAAILGVTLLLLGPWPI